MNSNTINDAQTVVGNGEGTLLAGRFRVVRQLGRGGMGSVWLVEDTLLDDMPFAVKMLPSVLVNNKRAYAQLKAEALVSLKLVHPNIVQLRAFEENDGNPFLVMDYIDGQTLDDYIAEHAGTTGGSPVLSGIPEADVLRILRPIASALDYAHSQGVVHRDVKPANVMIRKDGHPFILDFGIAREIQETMTRVTGKLSSGTLLYMSPEQLNGARPRKEQDIYSFAAMAFECLKGEPPFCRGNIEFQILNKAPEPLVEFSTTGSLPDGVNGQAVRSTSIAASVMAGLAKKPADRPPTCAAVLEGWGFSHKDHKEAKGTRIPRPPAIPLSEKTHKTEGGEGGRNLVVIVTIALFLVVAVACVVVNTSLQSERRRRKLRRAAEIRLESERQTAEAAKVDAESERTRAERADAKTRAYMFWSNAEDFMRQASEEFRQGRYGPAGSNFTSAADNYRHGAEKAEKRRLEEAEDERRRKLDEEMKASETKETAAESERKRAEEQRAKQAAEAAERERKRAEERRAKQAAETAEAKRKLAEKRAMAEEERRMAAIPKARFVVKIDGDEVFGARISYSGKTVFSPHEISSLEPNQRLGPFTVEYSSPDGGLYLGRFDQIAVDWQGLKIWNLPLSRATPMASQPRKIYAYEARIAPYVMEHGGKTYVPATIDDTLHDVFVRRETRNGQSYIVLGTHSFPEGLFHLKLRYGQLTAQKWISNSMFNSSVVEVELK